MRLNKVALPLLLMEILCIPTVIAIFKFISPKSTAALIAASLFLSIPLLSLKFFSHPIGFVRSFFKWGHWQFFLCFALPIFVLRVAFWGQEFDQIEFLSINARSIHHWSNISFIVMLISTSFGSLIRSNKS